MGQWAVWPSVGIRVAMGSEANFGPMGIMAFLGTEGPTWARWPFFFFLGNMGHFGHGGHIGHGRPRLGSMACFDNVGHD